MMISDSKNDMPKHLAIIMDGNGRWAEKKGKNRIQGHSHGVKAVQEVVEEAVQLNIQYLTLYAFSTENWSRPQEEIGVLMKLLVSTLKSEFQKLLKNRIKLNVIGNMHELPAFVQKELEYVVEHTQDNNDMTLTLALSYGGREELSYVFKQLATKVKNNIISPEKIDQSIINEHLYTQNLPDVDLLIRTSGEKRISNFLLWQIAYAELYFSKVLWPDFTKKHLHKAITSYKKRERRFGKTSKQLLG
ncbi:MAG: di-trans,poly-cis-decaprenylcistransferase [Flavobacteriaceae bacterium TMED204]|nr:MAG: di-trans,poly-cis-decaprenylcistransferase [Flavobacteriaceae bacterium TMED204]|tara:strand:+ start:4534 stop:5271 length:738 start_codon:yes stop_codon:yes gene_type:complete